MASFLDNLAMFGGGGQQPSQTGLDLNQALIKQLGERVGPKYEGPGGWWGHAVDAAHLVGEGALINQSKRMQTAMSGNTAGAISGSVGGGTPGLMPPSAPTMPSGAPGATPPPGPGASRGLTTGSLGAQGGSAVTPDYIAKVRSIESRGNPNARSGSHYGLFQFTPEEWQRWGNGGNISDPQAQLTAFNNKSHAEEQELSRRLGRPVSAGELYLAHQQGVEGAYKHLSNPDGHAWENMLDTGEGRQKGANWAYTAIAGNLPKDRQQDVGNMTSREFANYWVSKFGGLRPQSQEAPSGADRSFNRSLESSRLGVGEEETPAINKAPPVNDERMNVGGPQQEQPPRGGDAGEGAPPIERQQAEAKGPGDVQKLAQAAPAQGGAPGPNSTAQTAAPGTGPPAAYLQTPEQLGTLAFHLMQQGLKPNEVAEILKQYREQSAGQQIKTNMGPAWNVPKAGGGNTLVPPNPSLADTHFPLHVGPEGVSTETLPNTGFQPTVPGISTGQPPAGMPGQGQQSKAGPLDALTPFVRQAQDWKGQGKVIGDTADVLGGEISKAVGEAAVVPHQNRILGELKALNNEKWLSGGPTGPFITKVREFLDNFGVPTKGIPDTEVFNKLTYYLGAEQAKGLSSRVSNFNMLESLINQPNLMQSQKGRSMLIDLMQQDVKLKEGLGGEAKKYVGSNYMDWPEKAKEYYKEHYPIIHEPGKPALHTRDFTSREDMMAHVPVGERYVAPDDSGILTRQK